MFFSSFLTFSIITTKRNNTATAPTYTTINNIAKNSAFKNKNKIAELIKAKIKKRTEYTGFFEETTPKHDNTIIVEKI